MPVILADTAGLRRGGDPVEREGVRISEEYRQAADLVLEIRDASERVQAAPTQSDSRSLIVLNKTDLVAERELAELQVDRAMCLVSARTGEGIADLVDRIAGRLGADWLSSHEFALTRNRHFVGITSCLTCLRQARSGLEGSAPLEVVALELREACVAVDELIGKVYDDDVLNRIFGEFCIGK